MKTFLNILLLFLSMIYVVDSAYAWAPQHHSEEMEMECCDTPKADHSCCDDHHDEPCSSGNCCDCLLMTTTFYVEDFPDLKKIFETNFRAEFPLVISAFRSPSFPIWSPPDIA